MKDQTVWFPSFRPNSKESQKKFRTECDKAADKITTLKSGVLSNTLKCQDIAELISSYVIKNNNSVVKLLATKEKDINSIIIKEILRKIRSNESMFGKKINTSLLKKKAESKTTKSKIISSLKIIRKHYSTDIDEKINLTRVSIKDLKAISDNFKNIDFDTLIDMKEEQVMEKERKKKQQELNYKRLQKIKNVARVALVGAAIYQEINGAKREYYEGAGGGRWDYEGAGGGNISPSQFCKKYNCNTGEVRKKCYRAAAKRFHPDRGGNTESMQELNIDYEKLGDSKDKKCD